MKKLTTWFAKNPTIVVLAVSVILLACNIFFIGHYRPFNSDDIYWQQIVRTWVPFSGDTMYTGADNTYISKMPFFYLMENIFPASRALAMLETFLLTGFAFVSLYITALYILKKSKAKITYWVLLPFVWLASFGYAMVDNYLNVNWRTADMGISFLVYLAVAAILFGDINPLKSIRSKILSFLAIVVVAATIASDPYFVYFTIVPVVLITLAAYFYKRIKRAQVLVVIGFVGVSYVVSRVVEAVLTAAGMVVVTHPPSAFVNFDDIVTNIIASLHGLLIIYNANFFGLQTQVMAVGFLLNTIILGVIIVFIVRYLKTMVKAPKDRPKLVTLWLGFFALVPALVFLIYTSSSLALVSNYRFYMIFVYCSVLLLAIVVASIKNKSVRRIVGVLIICASLFNLGYTTVFRERSIFANSTVSVNRGNALNYALIDIMESKGLTKGYTSFWQGNINTYLSDGEVAALAVLCADGITIPFKWNVDGALYDRNAERTFYLYDPYFTTPGVCTPDQAIAQFGEPAEAFQYQNKTFLIYDYDIYTKMSSPASNN